jgi:hypothetical protein
MSSAGIGKAAALKVRHGALQAGQQNGAGTSAVAGLGALHESGC